MKTSGADDDSFPLPPALLAEVQAAAAEEHRPMKEIVGEAIRLYLERRSQTVSKTGTAEKARAFEVWARSHCYTPPCRLKPSGGRISSEMRK